MENKYYSEKQSFFTWWLGVLLVVLFVVQLVSIYNSADKENVAIWVGLIIFSVVTLFFVFVRLHTRIDEQGIEITFIPFARKKRWLWEDLGEVYIRKYSLSDYGGWGYRMGANGIAYNTRGKIGIQMVLKNGSKILIGTQNPDEVTRAIDEFRKIKSNENPN